MSNEQFATLMARLEVLDMQVQAQDRILLALALAMPVTERSALLEMLTALGLNAAVAEGANVAREMAGFAEKFLALTAPTLGASPAQVRLTLASLTALLNSAPAGTRTAQMHWLSIASAPEIEDELRALLPPLFPDSVAPKKRGKRAQGGGG